MIFRVGTVESVARIADAKSVHEAALFAHGGNAVVVDRDDAMNNRVLRLDVAGRIDRTFVAIPRVKRLFEPFWTAFLRRLTRRGCAA